MKKLEISISRDGIKVIGDGQELITPKAISISMEGDEVQAPAKSTKSDEEQAPTESSKSDEEPVGSIVYDFRDWHPSIIKTRLKEPVDNWGVLHNIAENKKSVNTPANAYVADGILHLAVSDIPASFGSTKKAFSSATVQSAKRCFGLGRTTVVANLPKSGKMCKFSIWLTTSPFHDDFDKVSHIDKQCIEVDAVEWTEADTGDCNTSRGMWFWHENKESVSDNRLPHINLEKKESVSGGSWWWNGVGWYQGPLYPICKNGNRLRGTNGMYYFVTNPERGTTIDSAGLTWIREDGLDGNRYFVAEPTVAKGGGADKSTFIDGKTPVYGWHKWSIVVEKEYIALECDGKEYYRSTEKMRLPDDIGFNLIFAVSVINEDFKGEYAMKVKEVRFTPKNQSILPVQVTKL